GRGGGRRGGGATTLAAQRGRRPGSRPTAIDGRQGGGARSPAAKAMPLGWLSGFAVDVFPGCPRRHRVEPPGMLDLGGHRRRGVWRRCLVWDIAGGVVSTTSAAPLAWCALSDSEVSVLNSCSRRAALATHTTGAP